MNDLNGAQFLKGMSGAENIYLDNSAHTIYVTDLRGTVYLVAGSARGELRIEDSIHVGELALGIVEGKDGYLYVGATRYAEKEYLTGKGGSLHRVSKDLKHSEVLFSGFPGINGLAADPGGNLYFTTGNLRFLKPEGRLYKVPFDSTRNCYDEPVVISDDLGSANGLYYSDYYAALILTETFGGVSMVYIPSHTRRTILDKTKMIEGFDDVTVDSEGRIWVAEPVGGCIKVFDPHEKKLTRFHIEGVGVGSSCRIGTNKNNEEVIYISERQHKKNNDGRGLIAIPINQLFEE